MQIPLKKKSVKSVKSVKSNRKKTKPKSSKPQKTVYPATIVVPQYALQVNWLNAVLTPQQRLNQRLMLLCYLCGTGMVIAALAVSQYGSLQAVINDWMMYSGIACIIAAVYLQYVNDIGPQTLCFSRDWCQVPGYRALAWSDVRVRLRIYNALDLAIDQPEQLERAEIWIKLPNLQEVRFNVCHGRTQIEVLQTFLICAPAGSLSPFSAEDSAEFQQKMLAILTSLRVLHLGTKAHSETRALAIFGGMCAGFLLGVLLYWLSSAWIAEEYSILVFTVCVVTSGLAVMEWTDFYFYTDRLELNQHGVHSRFYGEISWAQIACAKLNQHSESSVVILSVRDAVGQEQQLSWVSNYNRKKIAQFAKICQSHAAFV